MSDIQKLLDFFAFTHQFQKVIRVLYVPNEDRDENDAEHSYQLALIAWYLIESKNLPLDLSKTLKYALVHDLVEAYAGDTYIYTKDKKEKESKSSREEEAARKIKENFPLLLELHELIHTYELKEDEESKFIYALDKVVPVINIYMDGGRTWKRENITFEMIKMNKDHKVSQSKYLNDIWKDVKKLVEEKHEELYGTPLKSDLK